MKRSYLINLCLILAITNLSACSEPETIASGDSSDRLTQEQTQENRLIVTVSILPQKYFVEKIAGDLVTVNVMVEPGAAPETYEPSPQQLTELSRSSAYISIGVPFEESWLDKVTSTNSDLPLIDSGSNIEKIPMVGDHHHDHEEDGHNHEENEAEKAENQAEAENLDPHTWLSPRLAKIQAENIYQGLVQIDPQNQSIYQTNLANFLQEIEQLDQQIATKFAEVNNRAFIIHHPALGYLAQDYNLEQIPLEFEGQEVGSAQLVGLVKEAKEEQIRFVFAQPQFNNKTVTTFAQEIDAEVIIIDPLAENWSQNLLEITDKLVQAMKSQ